MIRWLVSLWRGPLCDAGTASGRGCLKAATFIPRVAPPGWSRGLRWCADHQFDAGQDSGLGLPARPPLTDAQLLDAELAVLVRRAEAAEAAAARLRAESEERRRGIEVTEDALHAAQAEVERLRKYEPALVEAHIREAEATARVKAPFARDFALTMAALLTEHGAPNYIETKVIHDTIGEIAVTVQRCAGKTPHEFRREAEEQRDAALAQLAVWRESVVAANRISQAFEERALKAEAERDLLRRMVDDSIVGPIPPGQPAPLPDAPAEYVLGYLARYVLTGEGESAEVDRWVEAARAWPVLYDEADATVSFAEMRRAAAMVHEQPAAPSQEPTT